jgi:hypothetical protein
MVNMKLKFKPKFWKKNINNFHVEFEIKSLTLSWFNYKYCITRKNNINLLKNQIVVINSMNYG